MKYRRSHYSKGNRTGKKKRILQFAGCLILCALILFFCNKQEILRSLMQISGSGSSLDQNPQLTSREADFRLTMLDVGQGLCLLIGADGEYMLYDGGGRNYSSYVISYLKQHGVNELQYLFASHYDDDHIAGLIGVLRTIPVKKVILPCYEADTEVYASFMNALSEAEADIEYAVTGHSYSFGRAVIDTLYAADGTEEKENDRCTVLKISHGQFSCMITGDAQAETEKILLNSGISLKCSAYVVGHHGSASSSTPDFIAAMKPEIALISVGADNEFGHPAERTLKTLNENHVHIFRTDTDGEIEVICNDSEYNVLTERDSRPQREAQHGDGYVLNNRTMKFHRPECEMANEIGEHNREISHENRWTLISYGYAPCGLCAP